MIENFNEILVLAPHTDDGELGLGGTISRLTALGKRVTYVAFSIAEQSVPEEFPKDILKTEVRNATSVLGVRPENVIVLNYEVRKLNYARQEILEDIVKIKRANNFDLVFIPSLHDVHQDHVTIAQEGLRAFKNTTILGYELIWNNLSFDTQCFVRLSRENIDTKIRALAEYHSQGRKDYLSKDFIRSLARARGVQCGSEFAESFEVVRLFL